MGRKCMHLLAFVYYFLIQEATNSEKLLLHVVEKLRVAMLAHSNHPTCVLDIRLDKCTKPYLVVGFQGVREHTDSPLLRGYLGFSTFNFLIH